MRIKQIYINKEGEPMANPEMDTPYRAHYILDDDGLERYDEAVKYWHSGLLPFEDREKLKDELFYQVTGGPQVDVPFNVMFKPDTLIPVDIEVEVVEQWASKEDSPLWYDVIGDDLGKDKSKFYRKVLRIKP